MADLRIISLLPAATEIVCALGLERFLVGRSHECDFPASAGSLPVCSSARLDPAAGSAEIDRQVKDILADALSVYAVDAALIRQLKPDIIITQTLCEVCAVSRKDLEAALEDILDKDCHIVSLEPRVLDDVFADIRNIGALTGAETEANELLELAEERIGIIRHKLKFITDKPKVACIEWLSPLMMAGNWTPELVDIAGGSSVLAENGKHSPFINFEQLKEEDPDLIVVMPCGFSVSRTLQEIGLLLELPGWNELKAVHNNQIYIADGNQYFNRSGPRLVDSIEILAEIINPKQFAFGYEGTGWIRFNV